MKKSTLALRIVIKKSLLLYRQYYLRLVALCLGMLLLHTLSGKLARYMQNMGLYGWKLWAVGLLYVVLLLVLQLSLVRVLLRAIDQKEHRSIKDYLPEPRELLYFFLSLLLVLGSMAGVIAAVAVLFWPLAYTDIQLDMLSSLSVVIGFLLSFLFLTRVCFYPFFIIEQGSGPVEALRWSFRVTKGNLGKLLLIVLCFAGFHLLQVYVNLLGSRLLWAAFSLINVMFIVPYGLILFTVSYRQMIAKRNLKKAPGLFIKNI